MEHTISDSNPSLEANRNATQIIAVDGKIECHLTVSNPDDRILDPLATATGLSRQRLKQAMQKGAVWLTRGKQTTRIRRSSKSLKVNDQVHAYYDEEILATEPTQCRLISDEDAYSVWYKPYGVRSQGSKWGDHCTIHRWVELHLKPQRPVFTVHRLDRAATGLMLIAHQKRVATKLAKLFEGRAIEKRYQAIVHGPYPVDNSVRILDTDIDGRNAKSYVKGIAYDSEAGRSLVEVVIETGRKHQIRKHLSEIGLPVQGDRMYGRNGDVVDLQLAAVRLAFVCPVSGENKAYDLPEELKLSL